MDSFNRRDVFKAGALSSVLAANSLLGRAIAEDREALRVGVIGHTGRGDYGHGLHTMWLGIPKSKIVGIADPNETGLKKACRLVGDAPGYASYEAMFREQRPEIVSIGMRHIDQHRDVALAAIEAGVKGLYIEKPFCRTPRECDEVIAAAEKRNTKVSIAHRNRFHPVLPVVKSLIQQGQIGDVIEYRMRGKEDTRGGSLDLWVLGSHTINLVHYFAGEPLSCSAVVLKQGKPANVDDAIDGAEGIGRYAGDEVHARYLMADGRVAYFDSIAKRGSPRSGFGVQIVGTQGIIDLRIDTEPLATLRAGSPFPRTDGRIDEASGWVPISTGGAGVVEPIENLKDKRSNHWLAGEDLIEAIENNRAPMCDGHQGRVTVEMITAAFQSHLLGGKSIDFPLVHRDNPWEI